MRQFSDTVYYKINLSAYGLHRDQEIKIKNWLNFKDYIYACD